MVDIIFVTTNKGKVETAKQKIDKNIIYIADTATV